MPTQHSQLSVAVVMAKFYNQIYNKYFKQVYVS